MATPTMPIDETASDQKPNPFLPRAFNPDIPARFADVIANVVNHSGAATTYIIRFIFLLLMALFLLLGEGFFRLDEFIEGQSANVAQFFLGGGR